MVASGLPDDFARPAEDDGALRRRAKNLNYRRTPRVRDIVLLSIEFDVRAPTVWAMVGPDRRGPKRPFSG